MAELLIFVETVADARPLPLRRLPRVVVHPVEVGAPRSARLGGNILQRCQQRVRNEELRAPPLNRCLRALRASDDAGGFPRPAIALIAPGPPTQELSAEIGNEDRQLAIEGRNLVLEVDRKAFVR